MEAPFWGRGVGGGIGQFTKMKSKSRAQISKLTRTLKYCNGKNHWWGKHHTNNNESTLMAVARNFGVRSSGPIVLDLWNQFRCSCSSIFTKALLQKPGQGHREQGHRVKVSELAEEWLFCSSIGLTHLMAFTEIVGKWRGTDTELLSVFGRNCTSDLILIYKLTRWESTTGPRDNEQYWKLYIF